MLALAILSRVIVIVSGAAVRVAFVRRPVERIMIKIDGLVANIGLANQNLCHDG